MICSICHLPIPDPCQSHYGDDGGPICTPCLGKGHGEIVQPGRAEGLKRFEFLTRTWRDMKPGASWTAREDCQGQLNQASKRFLDCQLSFPPIPKGFLDLLADWQEWFDSLKINKHVGEW